MLGIICLLIISWIFLHIAGKNNLSVLGFLPPIRRFRQFGMGFLFAGIICTILQLIDASLTHLSWTLRPHLTGTYLLNFFWLNVKSVLFEELIFRGAILYIAIQKFGFKAGIILSAISFGIYHWFSYGVFGSPISMVIIFTLTSSVGLIWAYAFAKTKSIALPIGLHLGWNFTINAIFSKGPSGIQVLVPVQGADYAELTGIPSLLLFLLSSFAFPILSYILIKIWFKQKKQSLVE